MTGRLGKHWSYSYEDLVELTGKSRNAIHQAASRGMRGIASGFHPDDFRSVVLWIFRNATDEFKLDIMTEMHFFRRGAKERLDDRMGKKAEPAQKKPVSTRKKTVSTQKKPVSTRKKTGATRKKTGATSAKSARK